MPPTTTSTSSLRQPREAQRPDPYPLGEPDFNDAWVRDGADSGAIPNWYLVLEPVLTTWKPECTMPF